MTPISAPHGHHLTQALNHSEVGASLAASQAQRQVPAHSQGSLFSHILGGFFSQCQDLTWAKVESWWHSGI